jgi:hypothetical protein
VHGIVLERLGSVVDIGELVMDDLEQLVERHIEALLGGDLQIAMRNYDERSVLLVGDDVHEGPAEIRRHLEALLEQSPEASVMERTVTHEGTGQVVLTWHLLDPGTGTTLGQGTDVFTIEDGVIRRQEVRHGLPS